MNRQAFACIAIVAMLAYQTETQIALACTAACGTGNSSPCRCPDSGPEDGDCHPNGRSMSVNPFTHATECRINLEATWSCATEGHSAKLRQQGATLSICSGAECSGNSWVANGLVSDVTCTPYTVSIDMAPNTCGSGQNQCVDGTQLVWNAIDCN